MIIAHDDQRGEEMLRPLLESVKEELERAAVNGEVFVETRGNKSESRNMAAAQAQGEVLLFLDDDVKLRPGFLQEILAPFTYPGVGVVGGVNVAFPEVSFMEEISASMMSSVLLWGKSASRYTPRGRVRESDESEIISCCMAVRSEAFREAGGFPLDVIPCEENMLINRIQELGWKIVYSPYAIVYHKRAEFPWDYARKLFDYGKGRGMMMRKSFSGKPRVLWKPSRKWLLFVLGTMLHFSCYGAGMLYGYLKRKQRAKK